MYLLVNQTSQSIVSMVDVERQDNPEVSEVFPGSDESNQLAWWEGDDIPTYFEINEEGDLVALGIEKMVERGLLELGPNEEIVDGEIVSIPLERLVAENKLALKPWEQIVDNQIVELSLSEKLEKELITLHAPYEYINGDEIANRTLAEVLEDTSVVSTLEEAQRVEQNFYKSIEQAVAQAFSPGYELKLTKDYTLWMAEGSPEGDKRQTKFEHMQQEIATIKDGFAEQKAKVRALVAGFQ